MISAKPTTILYAAALVLGIGGNTVAQEEVITGQVLDADGQPAHQATVELRWFTHPELPERIGRSLPSNGIETSIHELDEQGSFSIPCPRHTHFSLLARGPPAKSLGWFIPCSRERPPF